MGRRRALVGLVVAACAAVQGHAAFWSEVAPASEVPQLTEPGMAYCEAQDIGLLVGGLGGTIVSTSVYLYAFERGAMIETDLEAPQRRAPNLVSIDPHPEAPTTCRFLLYGGSADRGRDDLSSTNEVWLIEVVDPTSDPVDIRMNLVVAPNAAINGRLGAGATGFRNSMFVLNGYSRLESNPNQPALLTDVWRFTLDNAYLQVNSTNLSGGDAVRFPPQGRWTRVLDVEENRFFFSVSRMGDTLLAYAGQGVQSDGRSQSSVARSSMLQFDLVALDESEGLLKAEDAFSTITQLRNERVYRIGHVAATLDDWMFVYGGEKLVVGDRRNKLLDNDYVSVTRVTLPGSGQDGVSCITAEGDEVGWCAFREEFPSVSNPVSSLQRRDTLVALVDASDGLRLLALNLTSVRASGEPFFSDAFKADMEDAVENGLLALKSLQYSLIAVCIFLILSVAILFKQRGGVELGFVEQPKRNLGVSLEVIRALEFVKFDEGGAHIPVKVRFDANGEPHIVEELSTGHLAVAVDIGAAKAEAAAAEEARDDAEGASTDPADEKEGGAAASPLSTSFYHNAQDEDGELCPICLIDFEQDELLQRLPCGHLFHSDCVEPWLLKNATCPQDRIHVVTKQIEADPVDEDGEDEDGEAESEHSGADREGDGDGEADRRRAGGEMSDGEDEDEEQGDQEDGHTGRRGGAAAHSATSEGRRAVDASDGLVEVDLENGANDSAATAADAQDLAGAERLSERQVRSESAPHPPAALAPRGVRETMQSLSQVFRRNSTPNGRGSMTSRDRTPSY